FFDQVQVLVTVYSVDKVHAPNTVSLLAASFALSLSKIPFMEPVGVIEVARVNGEWIFNPEYQQAQASDVRLVVAGTQEGVVMVEGSMNELSEKEFVDVLFQAHDKIKRLVAWQLEIQQELGTIKEPVVDTYGWDR